MSKLTTGEWIVFAFLIVAALANLSGAAGGGALATVVWAIVAVIFVRWRIHRHERGRLGIMGWWRGDDLR